MSEMNVIFASFGNDSCALIQWARDQQMKDVVVMYNNTGWAAPEWEDRVENLVHWVEQIGFTMVHTTSEGFEDLAKRKMAFPRQGMQFCTEHLKRLPSLKWLDENDPNGEAVCFVGVRREESVNRATFPEWVEESEAHGGRSLHAPLVRHTEAMRNELLLKAGITPLPHRSMECYPCVNSNRNDLALVSEERIRIIENLEEEMGVGVRSGKAKYMFRPYRHMGAKGIREVIKWANSPRGKYDKDQQDLFCSSGFCE